MSARIPLIALVGLVLALCVALAFVGFRRDPAVTPPTPTPASQPSTQSVSPVAPELDRSALDTPDAAQDRTEVVTGAEAPRLNTAAECIVLGRVIDEHDEPVVAAVVRLQAYELWAQNEDVPRLDGPYDYRGFEVLTDGQGDFRIVAPVPTADRTWLTIEPDPHHDSYRVTFETQRSDGLPSLTAGKRDLGILRVATTGAVRGRVTDTSGRPLAEVKMGIGPSVSITYGRDTTTAADGTYLVAHAPVGTYGVKAKIEGFLSQFQNPVTVESARDTLDVDFVLEPAPSIEGLVLDEVGRPLEGARMHGWPSTSGSGAGANSGADGRFVVWLPQEEPYTLGAKLDGYRSWGDENDRSVRYEPGTRDIQVVLHSVPRTQFLIVDDESGEPVEHFGLVILADNGSKAARRSYRERRPPRQATHTDGVVEATARPGIDLYLVAADGYLAAEGDVEHESPDSPRQVVRLRRGATVVGRILRDGQPLASVSVDLELGFMRPAEGDLESPKFQSRRNARRSAVTDASGRFEVIALQRGTYRLTVRPDAAAPLVVVPFAVTGPGVTDAGDLTVLPGATVQGTVLLPPGVALGGLEVHLDDWRDGVSAVTNSEAEFRFENLSPGAHTLMVGDRPGVLAGSEAVSIELESGVTTSVTLDARDRATCQVTLVIDLGDLPAEGRQVDLVSVENPLESETLGKCDAAGRVTGHPRAWGEARVVVFLPGRGIVEHPTVRLQLDPGAVVEAVVRFEPARVTLVLPAGVEPPASGLATLELWTPDAEQPAKTVYLTFRNGRTDASTHDVARAESGTLWFGFLPVGAFELSLQLIDDETEMQQIPMGNGSFQLARPPFWEAKRSVQLRAGEDLRVVFE